MGHYLIHVVFVFEVFLTVSGVNGIFNQSFWQQLLPIPARCRFSMGQTVPDFSRIDTSGRTHQLSGYTGKPVVLAFVRIRAKSAYSAADGAAVRSLNAAASQFAGLGAKLLFISALPVAQAKSFSQALSLQVPLLIDPAGAIFRQYGAGQALGGPLSAQFVLDEQRRLRFQHLYSIAHPAASPERLLWAVRAML